MLASRRRARCDQIAAIAMTRITTRSAWTTTAAAARAVDTASVASRRLTPQSWQGDRRLAKLVIRGYLGWEPTEGTLAMDLNPGENVIYEGHPSWRSILAYYLKGLLAAIVVGALGALADGIGLGIGCALLVFAVVLVAGFLRRLATVYTISSQRLRIKRGIIARHVQQTDIDRVQNVNTKQSVLERLLQVGTVDFDTAGTGDSDFAFAGVENPEEVITAVDRAQKRSARHAAT
jgi:membrane protein YdbS with pleckstrin-like domain